MQWFIQMNIFVFLAGTTHFFFWNANTERFYLKLIRNVNKATEKLRVINLGRWLVWNNRDTHVLGTLLYMQICSPRLVLRIVWLKLTAGRYFLEQRLVYGDTQFKSAKYFNLERKKLRGKWKSTLVSQKQQ